MKTKTKELPVSRFDLECMLDEITDEKVDLWHALQDVLLCPESPTARRVAAEVLRKTDTTTKGG